MGVKGKHTLWFHNVETFLRFDKLQIGHLVILTQRYLELEPYVMIPDLVYTLIKVLNPSTYRLISLLEPTIAT